MNTVQRMESNKYMRQACQFISRIQIALNECNNLEYVLPAINSLPMAPYPNDDCIFFGYITSPEKNKIFDEEIGIDVFFDVEKRNVYLNYDLTELDICFSFNDPDMPEYIDQAINAACLLR